MPIWHWGVTIRDREGTVIRRGTNLRCIIDYTREHSPVERIDLFRGPQLGVTWRDGASCLTDFADPVVLRRWVKARACFRGAVINDKIDL